MQRYKKNSTFASLALIFVFDFCVLRPDAMFGLRQNEILLLFCIEGAKEWQNGQLKVNTN